MIIKEFNFLLKDTKSASEIKSSILPQLNLKATTENAGYIAKVYDTQSKKIYLLVSDNVKSEKNLSDSIFDISGGNSNSVSSSSVNQTSNEVAQESIKNIDEETIKNIVKETLNATPLKVTTTFKGNDSPISNPSIVASANNGDTYLDTKTNEVYFKNNDTWQKINTETTDLNGTGTPISTATLGQTYKDNLTGSLYVYTLVNGESKWKKIINVENVNSLSSKTWSGEGEPKTATTDAGMSEVKVGDIYHDTITDIYYMCVNVSGSTLTWKAVSKVEKEKQYPKVESNAIFGEIGGLGAGVAYLPETAATVGLRPMSGANDVSNENFGNFVDSNNNVFVCIPLMFYKADIVSRNAEFYNKPNIYISYVPEEGYAPFYAFKKSDDTYVPCVFVSKYLMSINEGKAISQKGKDVAMSYKGTYSGYDDSINISKISGCQARNDNFFKAANSMNEHTVLHYAALRFVYYMVAEAHMQAAVRKFGSISSVPSFICAYLDVEPYFPKGCNNNLSDINDTSIRYTQGPFSEMGCGMTGSCNKPEKTSFNGQKCGIMDMGGLMQEVDAGYIVAGIGRYDVTLALKGIDLLKSLNENTYSNTENYIQLDLTGRRNETWVSYSIVGSNQSPVFSFSYPNDDDTINKYNCDNFLIPLYEATNRDGTIAYGQDGNTVLIKDRVPLFGGSYYSGGSYCGLLYFSGYAYNGDGHSWSESNKYFSARAMIVPN